MLRPAGGDARTLRGNAVVREKFQFLPEASGNTTLWAVVVTGSPLPLLIGYLLLVNLWAFALMGFDKYRAKKKGARRLRERTLFLSALLGGGLGAFLGMWTFRHKTKHWYFVIGIPLILLAEAALAVWLYGRLPL